MALKGAWGAPASIRVRLGAALAIALEERALPATAGVLTPSVAFADVLVRRLQNAGIEISAATASAQS